MPVGTCIQQSKWLEIDCCTLTTHLNRRQFLAMGGSLLTAKLVPADRFWQQNLVWEDQFWQNFYQNQFGGITFGGNCFGVTAPLPAAISLISVALIDTCFPVVNTLSLFQIESTIY